VTIGPQRAKARFSVVTLVALAGPALLFVLLFLVYRFSLSGISENFLRAVQ